MTITPKQLEIEASYVQDAYMAMEDEIMKMLVRQLNKPTRTPLTEDNAFRWKIEKMQQLNLLNQQSLQQLVNETSQYSYDQLRKIIVDMGFEVVSDLDKNLSKQTEKQPPPRAEIDNVMESYFNQQWRDFDNHVNQTLIDTNYPNNPLAKMYQQVLNDTVAKIIGGAKTPQQALKEAIYAMVEKGVMTTFIDKAGREWSLERYVRMVLKSTTHRVYQDLRLNRGLEHGIVTALMSSHVAARPACAHIQGGWVLLVRTDEAPEELRHIPSIYDYGYGEPSGTQGIHCRHRLYIQIYDPDLKVHMKQYDPDEAIKNADIVSKQRRMEVAIRNAKRSLNAAKEMGDKEGERYFANLVRKRQAALRTYLAEHKGLLRRDYSREQVYSPASERDKANLAEDRKQKYGKIRSDINTEKFNRHVPGTMEYDRYLEKGTKAGQEPSIITANRDEIQKRIDEHVAEFGRDMAFDFIDFGFEIGIYVNQATGEKSPTTMGKVHFSKTGSHVVPTKPK